jgi:3-oxoacyl-[acyl-carrier protein] reductase
MDSDGTSSLVGKAAVINGASKSIGRAAAERLDAEGVNVVCNSSGVGGIDRGPLDAVVEAINQRSGGGAIAGCGPVEDFDYTAELINTCVDSFGSIDVLFNIAGVSSSKKSMVDIDLSEWRRLIDIHLNGTFNCCRHAAPLMVEQGSGAIVNTGSDAWTGSYAGTGYPAAKGGITSLSWAVARDLAGKNVRCNVISPGARTDMSTGDHYEKQIAQLHARGVLSDAARDQALRVAGPEFVAPMYAYLASDEAGHISGQLFRVSGNSIERYPLPRPKRVAKRPNAAGPWRLSELEACCKISRSAIRGPCDRRTLTNCLQGC